MKTIAAILILAGIASWALFSMLTSENANLSVQLSKATSEADIHTGVILYSGSSFQLVRVSINGIDYIANTKGGLIREHD